MLMEDANFKKVPVKKIAVHQDARFAFRFTQTLTRESMPHRHLVIDVSHCRETR